MRIAVNEPVFIPELLAPAGNPEKLRACLLYGADAVYLGGRSGNLRAACEGFDRAELEKGVAEANALGSRIYYCLNSLAREDDLASLPASIEEAASSGVHGFIIADPGVLRLARRYAPGVPVHLSTQANTSNSASAAFWADQGVSRVNLARELSARDIHAIRKAVPELELEVFVHGAMCLAVSGQCLLSAWLNGRSGNQGRCTQPCRFEYRAMGLQPPGDAARGPGAACPDDARVFAEGAPGLDAAVSAPGAALVVDEFTRPGEVVWFAGQEDRYSSFWAPQDLCLLPWLSWFSANRVTALKIEGRMKSAGWLAHVVDAYRVALDALRETDDVAHEPGPAFHPAAHGLNALPGARSGPGGGTGSETGGRGIKERLRDACMAEVLYPATRPLGTGFFLHNRRRNFTEELLAAGMASRPNRSGESRLPRLGRRLLARVIEPAGLGVWRIEAHGNWKRDMDVELMLPGLRRPVLVGGSYGLENQRGELAGSIGNGNRGLLYSDMPGIVPGIFIRAAE